VDAALAECPLFEGLTSKRRKQLARLVRVHDAADGAVFVKAGIATREVVVVVTGTVAVAGGGYVLATAGPGDVVAEQALAGPRSSPVTAYAKGPVQALIIGAEELLALVADEPLVAARLVRSLATRAANTAGAASAIAGKLAAAAPGPAGVTAAGPAAIPA
jgi:CRP-like cAMP-binding protein